MEIIRLRQILSRYWWIIAAGAVLIATAVLVLNLASPAEYQTEMSLIIVPRAQSSMGQSGSGDSYTTQDKKTLAETLGEMARSRRVLERAASSVNFDLLAKFDSGDLEREVSVLPETNVIRIVVIGHSPTEVAVAADALGRSSQAVASELPYPYSLEVLDSVEIPTEPMDNGLVTDTVLALIVGALAGFGAAFVLDYLRRPAPLDPEAEVRRAFSWHEREPLS
jgi:capsular polysaccharide biosynthesis protein